MIIRLLRTVDTATDEPNVKEGDSPAPQNLQPG